MRDSALRRDDSAFSHLAVTDHADLSRKNHLVADLRGTGQADLRAY